MNQSKTKPLFGWKADSTEKTQKILASFSEVRLLSLFLVILFYLVIPKELNPESSGITVKIPADTMCLTKFNMALWVPFNIYLSC